MAERPEQSPRQRQPLARLGRRIVVKVNGYEPLSVASASCRDPRRHVAWPRRSIHSMERRGGDR